VGESADAGIPRLAFDLRHVAVLDHEGRGCRDLPWLRRRRQYEGDQGIRIKGDGSQERIVPGGRGCRRGQRGGWWAGRRLGILGGVGWWLRRRGIARRGSIFDAGLDEQSRDCADQ
jgi:hypothetical protein